MSKTKSANSEELLYGNQDSKQEYSIKPEEKDFYLVRHYQTTGVNNNVEDPGTFTYQFYNPEIFEEYTREDEKNGKENTFVLMGGKYVVLNDPSKNEPKTEAPKAFTVDGVKFAPKIGEDKITFVSDTEGEDHKATAKELVKNNK